MTVNTREFLEQQLQNGICIVVFTKGNGEVRELECTLLESFIVKYEKKTDRVKPKNENILAVWDVESEGWRSFKVDSVISIDLFI